MLSWQTLTMLVYSANNGLVLMMNEYYLTYPFLYYARVRALFASFADLESTSLLCLSECLLVCFSLYAVSSPFRKPSVET